MFLRMPDTAVFLLWAYISVGITYVLWQSHGFCRNHIFFSLRDARRPRTTNSWKFWDENRWKITKRVQKASRTDQTCFKMVPGVVLVVIGVGLDCYRRLFGACSVLFGNFRWPIIVQGVSRLLHLVGPRIALPAAKAVFWVPNRCL